MSDTEAADCVAPEPLPEPKTNRLSDLPQHSSAETIKSFASVSVKLSETTAEFLQKLSASQRQYSLQLSTLVGTYRRKTQELKKRPVFVSDTHYNVWEKLLETTDEEAKSTLELANKLQETVAPDMLAQSAKKKLLFKKLFSYRSALTSKTDKLEQEVLKSYRDYCDQWAKYGEAMDKDTTKDSQILLSYNLHNNYVNQLSGFSNLHSLFYGQHIYTILNEVQTIHEELLSEYTRCMQAAIQLSQEKVTSSQNQLKSMSSVVMAVNSRQDVNQFVSTNSSSVTYPPPQQVFTPPEPANAKLPSLSEELQLIDLTQAPLQHMLEALKKEEQTLQAQMQKLSLEYESEQKLLQSYSTNPDLGDAHSIEVEMTYMRHTMREKEADISFVQGKLSLFSNLEALGFGDYAVADADLFGGEIESQSLALKSGVPRRTSECLVQGKEHGWSDYTKKLPAQCRYCSGIIQYPIRAGVECKVCRMTVHTKCQINVPYCSGAPPVPKSPILKRLKLKTVMQKIKSQGSRPESPVSVSSVDESPDIYTSIDGSRAFLPRPPPRAQSLEPTKSVLIRDSFFEPSGEWELPTHCVALYEYVKVNPNDMDLRAGEVVELMNTGSPDWWKGTTTSGKKGYFPAQYVQVVNPGDRVMRAAYDFLPTGDGQLPLEEGQIVIMTRDDGDGWLYGRVSDHEGLFPKNYVDEIADV